VRYEAYSFSFARMILAYVKSLAICINLQKLLRLSICDGKTGLCLFDLVWNENYVLIPASIGSLVSSFYQIAREFGDKGGTLLPLITLLYLYPFFIYLAFFFCRSV
jgi:hypothetical protein